MSRKGTDGVSSTGLVVIIGAVLLLLIIIVAVAQRGGQGGVVASYSGGSIGGGTNGVEAGEEAPFTVSGGTQTLSFTMLRAYPIRPPPEPLAGLHRGPS